MPIDPPSGEWARIVVAADNLITFAARERLAPGQVRPICLLHRAIVSNVERSTVWCRTSSANRGGAGEGT